MGRQSLCRPVTQRPSPGRRVIPAGVGEGAEVVRPSSAVGGPGFEPGEPGVPGVPGGMVRVAVTVTLGRAASAMGTTGVRAVPSTSSGGRALSSPGMTTGAAGGGSAELSIWADPAPAATTTPPPRP
ncbi:hypothetical protein [Microbispora rosea]